MGRPILANLPCPFLVPQCSTYIPTQNWDVINGCSLEYNFNPPIVENHTSLGNFISFQFPKIFGIFHQVAVYDTILAVILECYASRKSSLCD